MARFHKGLLMDGNSMVKWQDINIPKIFSLSVNVKIPIDSDYSYAILTLKNSKTGFFCTSTTRSDNQYRKFDPS